NVFGTPNHGLPGTVVTTLTGSGDDTVTVGEAGSVQGIVGALVIENPPRLTTLIVDDMADGFGRTVTLNTFTPPNDTPFGSITGLAPAPIQYETSDINSV